MVLHSDECVTVGLLHVHEQAALLEDLACTQGAGELRSRFLGGTYPEVAVDTSEDQQAGAEVGIDQREEIPAASNDVTRRHVDEQEVHAVD